MSTDLYGIRVMALEPEQRRVRLRVFVTYYDADEYDEALLDGDTSFFLRVLWDEADTRFEDGGPLGEQVSLDEILDEDWVDGNTWRFIERFEAVMSKNVPFTKTDIANLPSRSYDLEWFTDEELLVQTDYDVWVTDPRWLAHLSLGQNWTTTSYPTQADRLRPEDAPFVPDPRPPAVTLNVFPVDYDDDDEAGAQTASGSAISPDGRWLAVASGAGELVVYDVPAWTERLRMHSGVSAPSVDWLPGRPVVVLQSQAPTSPSWAYDMDAGAVVAAPPQRWLARSANGRYQLNRLADGTIIIGGEDETQQSLARGAGLTAAAFTPDGSRLYIAMAGDILALDPTTGAITEIIKTEYRSYASRGSEPVRSLAVDRTGRYLAAGATKRSPWSGSRMATFSYTSG
ncbi:lactonase family protein [Nonomuraea basaltis]|uniref:lactonase family protein n=1 Tax=Nonomuraea basaltis TaxID=2495887 RepID=UPI00110C4C83|nr:lactonase family protein [Nonomuraea basaltis]TMR88878.1 lactonase family protein [Nonomuraea basaltis]